MHDSEDPSAGGVLTYSNGELCPEAQKYRSLDLHFVCSSSSSYWNNVPSGTEFVEEPTACEYEIIVESSLGCPNECPRANNLVCGGNGICGYDDVQATAKCFCDLMWTGNDCTTADPNGEAEAAGNEGGGGGSSNSGTHAALIVMCLLLAGVIVVAAYMFNKLRKLQLDPDAYSELGNRFNELGQVSEQQERSFDP